MVKGLGVSRGDRIATICSAGDNALSLLVEEVDSVDAVDFSEEQIALAKVKAQAASRLPYDTYVDILDRKPADTSGLFPSLEDPTIRNILSKSQPLNDIGAFESRIVPILKKIFRHVYKKKSRGLQCKYPILENCAIRLMGREWFWKTLMPYFNYEYVNIDIEDSLKKNVKSMKSNNFCDSCYYDKIVKGTFDPSKPPYLKRKNYETISQNLKKIKFHNESMKSFLDRSNKKYDGIYLSDISDWMSQREFKELMKSCLSSVCVGGRIMFRELFVSHEATSLISDSTVYLDRLSSRLHREDRTPMYHSIKVYENKY